MSFKINKIIEFSPFFLKAIPTRSPTYLLFSAITIAMVEKFKKQDSVW